MNLVLLRRRKFWINVSARRDVELLAERHHSPVLWEDACFRLLVPALHFHTASIFLRCSSTRLASVATSLLICGSGVAYRSARRRMRLVRVWETRFSSPCTAAARVVSHLSSTTR